MLGESTIVIWNVEHGAAAFCECPNGKTLMLDAGRSDGFSPAQWLHEQYGFNPKLKRVDHLIISHPDQDHIADLPDVKRLLSPRILSRNKSIPATLSYGDTGGTMTAAKQVYKQMDEGYNQPVSVEDRNEPASNWGGVIKWSYQLNASKHNDLGRDGSCNNYSVVTTLQYGRTIVVFPGDIEDAGMQRLMAVSDICTRIGACEYRVLIAPHHGRKVGVCMPFLDKMKPHLTVLSDRRGIETTDVQTYRDHSLGWPVDDGSSSSLSDRSVVTTRTNSYILLKITESGLSVTV